MFMMGTDVGLEDVALYNLQVAQTMKNSMRSFQPTSILLNTLSLWKSSLWLSQRLYGFGKPES